MAAIGFFAAKNLSAIHPIGPIGTRLVATSRVHNSCWNMLVQIVVYCLGYHMYHHFIRNMVLSNFYMGAITGVQTRSMKQNEGHLCNFDQRKTEIVQTGFFLGIRSWKVMKLQTLTARNLGKREMIGKRFDDIWVSRNCFLNTKHGGGDSLKILGKRWTLRSWRSWMMNGGSVLTSSNPR